MFVQTTLTRDLSVVVELHSNSEFRIMSLCSQFTHCVYEQPVRVVFFQSSQMAFPAFDLINFLGLAWNTREPCQLRNSQLLDHPHPNILQIHPFTSYTFSTLNRYTCFRAQIAFVVIACEQCGRSIRTYMPYMHGFKIHTTSYLQYILNICCNSVHIL